MRRFSHWEYEDRRTFWGWRREWYAVYVEAYPVVTVNIYFEIRSQDSEVDRIRRETERMRALKQQLDAEAAMLDSYINFARKQVELQGLIQVADRRSMANEQKLIEYQPQMPMAKVR